MAKFNMSIKHGLSGEEALRRTKLLLGKLQADQPDTLTELYEKWEGETGKFSCEVMGFKVEGLIAVGPDEVLIKAKGPMEIIFVRDEAKKLIREYARELFRTNFAPDKSESITNFKQGDLRSSGNPNQLEGA